MEIYRKLLSGIGTQRTHMKVGCQCNFLTRKTYKMWTILNVFVYLTHTEHTPLIQVMTTARLIIFNPRFQGGYHQKVTTIASNCFRGVTNLFVETSKPAPRVSCSLLIMAIVLRRRLALLLRVNVLSIRASQTSKTEDGLEAGWMPCC